VSTGVAGADIRGVSAATNTAATDSMAKIIPSAFECEASVLRGLKTAAHH